jgi:hypothetical protein
MEKQAPSPEAELSKAGFIAYEASDGIATITLNRGEKANAQTLEMLDDLDDACRRAAEDAEVRVIVLQANGKHFSSGHDIQAVGEGDEIAQRHPVALRQAKRAVNQTLDVQGFYAGIQSVFEVHQNGHGHALSESGLPILMRLDDMKGEIRKQ